jgi:hypothetical protein
MCRQLGLSGPAPIVRVRTVNQDFHDHSGQPLAESILRRLKAVNYRTVESPVERLRIFRHYLQSMTNKNYLPEHARRPILSELCRVVTSLANNEFHSAWRDMVAQFNSESDELRGQLQADMDRNAAKVELYGDGDVAFTFKTPAW